MHRGSDHEPGLQPPAHDPAQASPPIAANSAAEARPAEGRQARLGQALVPLRRRLETHPLHAALVDGPSLRRFMQAHVFAVWDFQCLLKALQRTLTCVEVPWLPTRDPEARRLINAIVLDEESDEAPGGGHLSHFELYLAAMREAGADTGAIDAFLAALAAGRPLAEALAGPLPAGVRPFVETTLAVARCGEPHRLAAAFAYGREDVIPGMFRRLVERLARLAPGSWSTLRFYLERHIGRDAEVHGAQSAAIVARLCGDDDRRWEQARETAVASLQARARLWDAVAGAVAGSAPVDAPGRDGQAAIPG